MKLAHCNEHEAKGKDCLACLKIRNAAGHALSTKEIFAEIVRLRNVAQAADDLMATLGAYGEISTLHPKTQILLDALYEWRPEFAEVSNAELRGRAL